MTTTRTITTVTAVLTATTLLLATSCGEDAESAVDAADSACPVADLSTDDPTSVRFAYATLGGRESLVLAELVERFRVEHPEVSVELVPRDAGPAFAGMFVADASASDVSVVLFDAPLEFGAVADAGALGALDDCIAATGTDLSGFDPALVADGRRGGEQVGLPITRVAHVLLYDRAALAAAGLDPDAPPRTLDELESMAAALTDHGVTHPFVPEAPGMLLVPAGGSPLDPSSQDAALDTDVSRSVASAYRSLAGNGTIGVLDDGGHVVAFERQIDPLTALADGLIAMTTAAAGSMWSVSRGAQDGQAPGTDLAVAAIPGLVGDPVVAVDASHVAVTSGLEPRELAAAWTFASWLAEPAQQATLYAELDLVPSRADVAGETVVQELWRDHPLIQDTWDIVSGGGVSVPDGGPLNVGFATFDRFLAEAVSDPSADIDVVLGAAQSELEAILAAQRRDPVGWLACATGVGADCPDGHP